MEPYKQNSINIRRGALTMLLLLPFLLAMRCGPDHDEFNPCTLEILPDTTFQTDSTSNMVIVGSPNFAMHLDTLMSTYPIYFSNADTTMMILNSVKRQDTLIVGTKYKVFYNSSDDEFQSQLAEIDVKRHTFDSVHVIQPTSSQLNGCVIKVYY